MTNFAPFSLFRRSSSQSKDNFKTFIDNFELNIENLSRRNPFLLVATSGFNGKSTFWYLQ